MAINITGKQKRYLRALGSVLQPVVQVGKAGLDEAVINSVEDVLAARELIKVRVLRNCPEETADIMHQLAHEVDAELVQIIGHNGLLYRPNSEKPRIQLP